MHCGHWLVDYAYLGHCRGAGKWGYDDFLRRCARLAPTRSTSTKCSQKYHVNKLMTAPTLIRGLMRHGEGLAESCDLSYLDTICVLGEPFNPEAWHWADENLGKGRAYINNMWGQTEIGGCPLAGAAWLTPMKPGSCGGRFLGAHLDVVDDDGRSLGPNIPGNLVVRAPFPG